MRLSSTTGVFESPRLRLFDKCNGDTELLFVRSLCLAGDDSRASLAPERGLRERCCRLAGDASRLLRLRDGVMDRREAGGDLRRDS